VKSVARRVTDAKIEIGNGRVIDPKHGLDRTATLYIAAGKVNLAKLELAEIAKRCGTTCEEYQDLAEELQKTAN